VTGRPAGRHEVTARLARRGAVMLITLWAVTLLAFVLLRVAPGDAALGALARSPGEGFLTPDQIEARRHALGLDRTYMNQYLDWLWGLVRLDAGRSLASGIPVLEELAPRFAVTLELAALTTLLVAGLAVPAGLIAASRAGSWVDRGVRAAALSFLALPSFWVGLLLLLALASWFGFFRAVDYAAPSVDLWRNLQQVGPAALVLALRPAGLLTRVIRASSIEALAADYVRAARARGVGEAAIVWRHVLRTAAPHAVTVLGAQVVYLLGGAIVVEQLFSLPGLGRAMASAVLARDYPVVQLLVLAFGVVAISVNLAVDMAHGLLDPRVRGADAAGGGAR